ncbi:tetratricopeptide repeat protein [Pelotomaculum isophthalicicum JI]|uniref:Tetratricopeptide repeat protein n=1 Tax=Pelotomaculum isophthalicicum JI TaxID=947010 RepID=A0A9X4GZV3_9FIRM|nr:CheR family methyltransferase [Pelotomaculum isophthalicicum]MDF9409185.1 tetratricopeptide repeat protein [Pelotomaculum isophthalicicum JI]
MSSHLSNYQIDILASHLTVGETYFYRDKKIFNVLEKHIIPELINSYNLLEKRQPIRIWSAGCSTGEEPYSIAILLDKMNYYLRDWHISILGTDINSNFLKKALEGIYSEWSFRDTPAWIKERFFKHSKDNRFEVLPHIKRMVQFAQLNLAEETYPSVLNNTSAVNVIFCRNVLIYLSHEQKEKVIQRLFRSLKPGGWLITSPAEAAPDLYSQFTKLNYDGTILFKKNDLQTNLINNFATIQSKTEKYLPGDSSLEYQPKYTDVFHADLSEKTTVQSFDDGVLIDAQASNEDSRNDSKMAYLARICANQGKLDEALECCEKAICADKLNPGLHYLFATILQEKEQVEEAIVSLKRALYLDPNFVLAHFALGNITMRQGNHLESKKHYKNALTLLTKYAQEDILPESEGITAGRLSEIIAGIIGSRILR